VFREENFQAALAALVPKEEQSGRKKQNKGNTDCYKIVKMIMVRRREAGGWCWERENRIGIRSKLINTGEALRAGHRILFLEEVLRDFSAANGQTRLQQ
jgi:hypothetical protein